MNSGILGLFSDPWMNVPRESRAAARNPVSMYRYAVWFKANPRTEAYMRTLFAERYPQGRFVNADSDSAWRGQAAAAGTVVLLYPDATGLGFRRLERDVRGAARGGAVLRILNGRRRDFRLDRATLAALRLRRLLERLMLLELLAVAMFVLATPLLLARDWMVGRR